MAGGPAGHALVTASPWRWCAQTSIIDCQVDLDPPPTTVAGALNSRVAREHIALQGNACVKVLVAKLAWLRQGEGRCIAHVAIRMCDAFERKPLDASFAERYGRPARNGGRPR